MKVFAIFLLLLGGYGIANSNDPDRIVIEGEGQSHPILRLIDIPSPGLLHKKSGKAFLLQKDSGEYIEIDQSVVIGFDSVLQLEIGSSVSISFNDGSYIDLGPASETIWYKFTMANIENGP